MGEIERERGVWHGGISRIINVATTAAVAATHTDTIRVSRSVPVLLYQLQKYIHNFEFL